MVAMLQMIFWNAFKYVPGCLIDDNSALVQVRVWVQVQVQVPVSTKPLPESKLTMTIKASLSHTELSLES